MQRKKKVVRGLMFEKKKYIVLKKIKDFGENSPRKKVPEHHEKLYILS